MDSYTNAPVFQEFSNRPRMLKDFLRDDADLPCKSMVQLSSSSKSTVLLRSRSKRAAVSAIHRAVNVVRFFQFAARKSPLTFLHRSFSRKLSAAKGADVDSEAKLVKVKDILRWRSFKDLVEEVEEESKPSDLPSPTTTIDGSSSFGKETSSWCDSDFTAEEYEETCADGQRSALLKNLKGDLQLEESAQQSPVSVLDSPFREYSVSSIHPRLANNTKRARCMLMQRIEALESPKTRKSPNLYYKMDDINQEQRLANNEAEEKAMELLVESNLTHFLESRNEERLVFDFFVHELSKITEDRKILGFVHSWMSGDYEESYEWEVEKNRVAYVEDMERDLSWKNFRLEEEEIAKGLEISLLNEFLDELLSHECISSKSVVKIR